MYMLVNEHEENHAFAYESEECLDWTFKEVSEGYLLKATNSPHMIKAVF
jgi:hypothetical protein